MLGQVQTRGVVAEAEPSTGKGRSQVSVSFESVVLRSVVLITQVVGSHAPLCMVPFQTNGSLITIVALHGCLRSTWTRWSINPAALTLGTSRRRVKR